jgi:hypothetical protein
MLSARARRDVGFPGDSFAFAASTEPPSPDDEIEWSGGGEPAGGRGRTFNTVFPAGGSFTVVARRGQESAELPIVVCPIDRWLQGAREFFGNSVDLSRVRVRESRLVLGRAGTGWTCNDVIRFKRARRADDLPAEPTLIHELGHVWEHQTGQAQLLRGLIEQVGRLRGRDPYDFGGPAGVQRATMLVSFSKESQAQILTEYWKSQHGYVSDARGVPFTEPGYVEHLRRLVQDAGIGGQPRRRRSLAGWIDSGVARLVNAVLRLVGG